MSEKPSDSSRQRLVMFGIAWRIVERYRVMVACAVRLLFELPRMAKEKDFMCLARRGLDDTKVDRSVSMGRNSCLH